MKSSTTGARADRRPWPFGSKYERTSCSDQPPSTAGSRENFVQPCQAATSAIGGQRKGRAGWAQPGRLDSGGSQFQLDCGICRSGGLRCRVSGSRHGHVYKYSKGVAPLLKCDQSPDRGAARNKGPAFWLCCVPAEVNPAMQGCEGFANSAEGRTKCQSFASRRLLSSIRLKAV